MASAPRIRPALRVWRIRGLDQWDLVADGDIKQGIMASMLTEHNTTFSSTLVARVQYSRIVDAVPFSSKDWQDEDGWHQACHTTLYIHDTALTQ